MIGIIGAMPIEVEAIHALMENIRIEEFHHTKFYLGTLNGKDVCVMLSGVGKGNASMNTTKLLMRYPITKLINIGTAGGLLENQKVLDVVISTRVIQHDYDTSFLDGQEGIGLYFDVTKSLVEKAKDILENKEYQVFIGDIVSGDQFIASTEQIQALKTKFPHAICAEMEAGAIGQVATNFGMEYIVLRSLSDVALNPDSHLDFMEYAKAASVRSAKFCHTFVGLL